MFFAISTVDTSLTLSGEAFQCERPWGAGAGPIRRARASVGDLPRFRHEPFVWLIHELRCEMRRRTRDCVQWRLAVGGS